MEKKFRRDYTGEFVVHVNTKIKGQATQVREWIPNTIDTQHTGHALVFGNGSSRLFYPVSFDLFTSHRGGLNASKKLTTYGCNALHREHATHITVVTHPVIAKEMVDSGYAPNQIVVTNSKNILTYPDKFHLIPFNPHFAAGPTALYLAAFDGHNHIYFMGFDGHESTTWNNNVYAGTNGYGAKTAHVDSTKWEDQCMEIFNAYYNIEFIRVMPSGSHNMPEKWKYANNLRHIGWRQFVSEVDLGST